MIKPAIARTIMTSMMVKPFWSAFLILLSMANAPFAYVVNAYGLMIDTVMVKSKLFWC
jgi:hypothetical protein